MPAPKSRKRKRWQVCPECRQIKGRDGFHEDKKTPNGLASWCIECTRARQYEEWRRKRRKKNRGREAQLREKGRKRLLARRLFREGVWQEEIVRRTGLPRVTVSRFLADLKPDRDAEIARLYVEEEVSTLWLGEHFGLTRQGVAAILRRLGVATRPPNGWHHKKVDATKPTVGQVVRAARHRDLVPRSRLPKGGNIGGSLTQKGHLLLEILRAAPAPLSVKQIVYIGKGLETRRFSLHHAATRDALKRLARHGFVQAGDGLITGPWGRAVVGWFVPSDQKVDLKLSPSEIERQIEIRRLIEQQKDEEKQGDRLGRGRAVSIDAPITENGFTILDTLGAEDENFAELAA